jgi:hypothetical protein
MKMAGKKGVVLESGRAWAVILLPNGEYKKIKTSQYLEVGELYQEKGRSQLKYVAAAVIFLTVILTTIDYFSVQAYAQVSSLMELGVNRWGRVISVQAKDNDGKIILDTVKVKNDKLEIAVEKIYNRELENDQAGEKSIQKPVLSVVVRDKSNKILEQKIIEKMDSGLQRALLIKKQKHDEPKEQSSEEKSTINNNGDSRQPAAPAQTSNQQNKGSNSELKRDIEREQGDKQENIQKEKGNRGK